jgi:hypothetical protein
VQLVTRLNRLLPALILVAGSAAWAASPPAPAPDQVSAQIERAEQMRQAAAARGAEWLATGGLIEQARKAAADENWDTARRLASQAKQQAELAIEQSERESTAWRNRVIR